MFPTILRHRGAMSAVRRRPNAADRSDFAETAESSRTDILSLGLQYYIRHYHLLHRDAAVLERIAVIAYEFVGVVVIDQKIGVVSENIARREVYSRQLDILGTRHLVHLARVVLQVAACLVTQIGRGLAVARHLHGVVDADGTVVGGDDYRVSALREQFEQYEQSVRTTNA